MKKIAYTCAIALLSMVSCKKDFLEREPQATVTLNALYKTDKDFDDAVIGCYTPLQSQYQVYWVFGDLRGDDSRHEVLANLGRVAVDVFTLNNDDPLLRDTWRNYYQLISRANLLLSKIESADASVVKNKERYRAEAKFLRALAYFDLVRIFGDVPMITTPILVEDAYKTGRQKVDQVYNDVIIKDLMDAETALPASYTGVQVGRATKGAAKALLGKVYLTRKDFVKAEAKLREVTTMGYGLLDNYQDLWDYSKNEHHKEYIFDIEYEEGIGEGSSITNQFLPQFTPIADIFGVKGTLGDNNAPPPHLYNLFEPNDVRRDITVVQGGVKDRNGNFVRLPPQTQQSFTLKYITSVPMGNDSKANWKVIRYADVLLMYAEVLNENGKTAEALDYLNMVRTRAKVQGYSNLDQNETREKIYLERRLELSSEGQRWFDLVRTGRALSVMQPYGMKPHMTVFPVPLNQIQIINDRSIFPQNPGYE
jgi:starch-binding outer membrane protein, SusD/RagB family